MSYDIDLLDPVTKETIELDAPHQMKGGTYAVDGTTDASINITWNYRPIFVRVFGEEGIRSLYGKTGAEAINILNDAIDDLADDTDPNYWEATEGNVKKALCNLKALCQMKPDGIISGD